MHKRRGELYAFALKASIPLNSERLQRYVLKVSQINQVGKTVGGATVVYAVT
jgi:hypothetical protein